MALSIRFPLVEYAFKGQAALSMGASSLITRNINYKNMDPAVKPVAAALNSIAKPVAAALKPMKNQKNADIIANIEMWVRKIR